jgi:hypothetical protein
MAYFVCPVMRTLNILAFESIEIARSVMSQSKSLGFRSLMSRGVASGRSGKPAVLGNEISKPNAKRPASLTACELNDASKIGKSVSRLD